MHMRGFAVVAVLLLRPPAFRRNQAYFPVDELRPGMVGIGRTVFEGDRLEEFKVHILGVLRNQIGPRRDLILARLEGGPLAKTGVIAGMSGSPVYIDGRCSARCPTHSASSPRSRSPASRRSAR